jgi:hypothetical protein
VTYRVVSPALVYTAESAIVVVPEASTSAKSMHTAATSMDLTAAKSGGRSIRWGGVGSGVTLARASAVSQLIRMLE